MSNAKNRPNIVWLTYEDTSPQFVSCYGMTRVQTTPVMDSLAADGVRFNHAYATAPVCSASRSALITGVCNQATGLGHHRSKYPIPRDLIHGFPYYLGKAGYYTTNNDKTDYNIENEADFIDETWNESSTSAHWRNRRGDQPFFSVFNYMDSHQSRTMTMPWGWYEENVLRELDSEEIIEASDVVMPPFYRDTGEMRAHLSRVYNSLRLCDRRIGERIAELRADGLLDDTIIFCFADHGEGVPRGKTNGIGLGYRAAFVVWVPERYRDRCPWKAGTATDELFTFEDLAPTVLSLAGIRVPDHMTGRPLMGRQRRDPRSVVFAARDRIDDTPDLCRSAMDGRFVYTRNFYPHLPVVKYQKYGDVAEIQRAIRRDYARGRLNEIQAELVRPTRPIEYLFDLSADPWETCNLATMPEYHEDLVRLRDSTMNHIRDTHDVMFLPEREMISRAHGGTPYDLRGEYAYNPLSDMLEVAQLVGDTEAVGRQLKLLDHDDNVVRYWAAVGLYAARNHLGEAVEAIRSRLHDDSVCVRIELAGALVGACDDDEAVRLLSREIESEESLVSHQALTKVLYMPERAERFAEAVERVVSGSEYPESLRFPAKRAAEMYMYLYRHAPLYYPEHLPYIDLRRCVRDC